MSEILVVSTVGPQRLGILGSLTAAGHHVYGAGSFEEATRLLSTMTPDLVIADERLQAYNGMHVLLRARSYKPQVGAIVVTTEKTRALEDDARRLNVQCSLRPEAPDEWVALVSGALRNYPGDASADAMRAHTLSGKQSHAHIGLTA